MTYSTSTRRSKSRRRAHGFCLEPLEARALLTVTIQLDYTYDSRGFFNDAERRSVFQAAADYLGNRLGDHLLAIEPGGGNSWTANLIDPSDQDEMIALDNLTIPADTIRLYVGAQNFDPLAIGGPGQSDATGTSEWRTLVNARGQSNVDGTNARDFGPYGGTIIFDTQPEGGWYFGLNGDLINGANDFFSVAIHEIGHVLGIGLSDSWDSQTFGATFRGQSSVNNYDGPGNVPTTGDNGHWASTVTDNGQETGMDPDLAPGDRALFTGLDFAGLDDIGWEIPLTASVATTTSRTSAVASNARFNINYTHYTDIAESSLSDGDLVVTGPNGFTATALFISDDDHGDSINGTYAFQPPGGSFDAADAGTYSVSLVSNAVSDAYGNFTTAGPIGSFDVSITGKQFSSGNDLSFTDASGDPVVISLKGPGSGQAFFDSTGNADASLIVFSNTGLATSLTITAGGAGSPVGGMTVNGSLKSVTFKNADLAGPMDVTGSIPKLAFRNASGSISLDGDGAPVTITLVQAVDLSITSAVAIKSIKVNEWLDNDATPDVITTPVLTVLAVKGALGAGISADTIGKVTAGSLNGSEIRATGNIASIAATSAAASTIFAGIRADVLTLPDSTDDFANPAATIASITFKGKTPGTFSNTLVAAGVLGKVSLGTIASANGGVAFGAAGLSIKSAAGATDSAGPFKKSKLDDPSGSLVAGDFNLRVL